MCATLSLPKTLIHSAKREVWANSFGDNWSLIGIILNLRAYKAVAAMADELRFA